MKKSLFKANFASKAEVASSVRLELLSLYMKNIVPHLWFDKEAREAAEFYVTVFPESKITSLHTIHDTPSGDCDALVFELWGQPFASISALTISSRYLRALDIVVTGPVFGMMIMLS
jgi:hypothetical protein